MAALAVAMPGLGLLVATTAVAMLAFSAVLDRARAAYAWFDALVAPEDDRSVSIDDVLRTVCGVLTLWLVPFSSICLHLLKWLARRRRCSCPPPPPASTTAPRPARRPPPCRGPTRARRPVACAPRLLSAWHAAARRYAALPQPPLARPRPLLPWPHAPRELSQKSAGPRPTRGPVSLPQTRARVKAWGA